MNYRRVVLITGCSSGFGYLTAKLLAENGYRVYAGVRKKKDLTVFRLGKKILRFAQDDAVQYDTDRLAERTDTGGGVYPRTVLLDVTWTRERINKIVQSIKRKEGGIDVLVNNAGFGYFGTVGSFSEEEVREQFETNVLGLFRVTKAVLPLMEKRRKGLVINVSSSAGLYTSAYYGVYSASKFAVEALTAALRAEESLYGVHVVAVNPGSFETKFWQNGKFPKVVGDSSDSPTGKLARRIKNLVLKTANRRGNPANFAKKVKEIIETENPRKNYLIGWDAVFLYWISRFFPQTILDWAVKKVVKRLA